MDDSDDDVGIITPTKQRKRSFEDDDGDVYHLMAAVGMPQGADDDDVLTSKVKQHKRIVVLYDPDDDDGAMPAVDDNLENEDVDELMDIGGSKEPLDWFRIYLTYLEECLLNPSFETNPSIPVVYKHSIQRVERGLLQRRDSLRGNVFWPSGLVESIDTMPQIVESEGDGDTNCYACNRTRHPAHYALIFQGVACNAPDLYRNGWHHHLFECLKSENETCYVYYLCGMCSQRVLLYWSLNQAKRQWCNIVWRKIVEHGGNHIPPEDREKLHRTEYGRYKKLLGMVDGMEVQESPLSRIRNVWANVRQMTIDEADDGEGARGRRRRGVVTSLVDERDGEEQVAVDDEEKEDEPAPTSRPSPAKPAAPKDDVPRDANLCLVCNKRRRTGGILHGYYVHIYCCFECAKALQEKQKLCAACSRPMERIIHLLQLNDEEEGRIRALHASSR